jgi:hypothetical protein
VAGIRDSSRPGCAEKTITPSRFQAPPRPEKASHKASAGPPDASILFSLPSAKKPRARLSADQKGNIAPSVPGSAWAVGPSKGRSQSRLRPSSPLATNAIRWPSGERTGRPYRTLKVVRDGGRRVDWIVRGGSRVASRQRETDSPARPAAAIDTAAQAMRSRLIRRARTGGPASPEPASRIHVSSFSRSWALCQRSSGSLARQLATTRSRAGGVSGWRREIGGGSEASIAAMRLAWLLPLKARWPVAIS